MSIKKMQYECRVTALEHGFDSRDRHPAVSIALMHSELSECLEAIREDPTMLKADKHCPNNSAVGIELADCIIRIFDFAEANGLNMGAHIGAKMAFNKFREYKHGKDF